jgi:8-oxo-dGTP pyrophosphatase MutT (NUDIX family)
MSTELEESFGGVVVRDGDVLVITPAGRPQISTLPKGGPQEGESPWVTATREVREETGVEARIVERLGDVRYRYRRGGVRVFKTVGFYLCDYVSGDTADHDHEVEEARWVPLERARTELTYPGEREMIERALSKHSGSM